MTVQHRCGRESCTASSLAWRTPMDKRVISLLKTQCYVDGRWVGEPKLSVTNPATGEEVAKVPLMSAEDTRKAVQAAERAFAGWSRMLAKERSKILRRWFELQMEHADEL